MKQFFRKTFSLLLALTLLCSLALPAAASDALGDELTAKDILLNEETQLSTNVFWSAAYSDLRTENLITYTPNEDVIPIVTAGTVLTERDSVTSAASYLEAEGWRVVAGINGDFYNVGNGLPIGIVVTEGELRSSDAGYHAVGFREDGAAVLGKPGVKITANLNYGRDDELGNYIGYSSRQIAGVNKARVSTGGIYLYTHDFNDRHTTGNTEAGVDVVCTILDGRLSIGETMTLVVDQVLEATAATSIGEGQVVLSVNLKSDAYHVDALRNIPVGAEITLTAEAADEEWNDVEYAVGALYSLVENGAVADRLEAGAAPRTAIGQKRDGTLVFYTIDGRRSGHSIGASMTQVAERLIELGCETAVCLDGGGSTTMAVTKPDDTAIQVVNRPSDNGLERTVTNQIFLVADGEPSGRLSHFYVSADHDYVLAGSKVTISAAAVDTNFIPMDDRGYDLRASDGELDGDILTTPKRGGEITITAEAGGREGSATVYAIDEPDEVAIRDGENNILTSLTAVPGSRTTLTGSAAYRHLPLHADPDCFTWTVEGDIGAISEEGVFTATAPGTGTITVEAGGKRSSIPVTVSRVSLKTVEDFESEETIFDGTHADNAWFSRVTGSEQVRLGRGAAKLDYTLTEDRNYTAEWRSWGYTPEITIPYTSLNLWVYGDGSGNVLSFLYSNDTKGHLTEPITTLDFTGWKQVSVTLPHEWFVIQGLVVRAGEPVIHMDENGQTVYEYPETVRDGTVYIDHLVASFGGTVDNEAPAVTLAPSESGPTLLTGTVTDTVDGVLSKEAISVTWDGAAQDFTYNAETGAFTTSAVSDGAPHRVTVTARDASGNIGRASYDLPVSEEWTPVFSDTQGYWAASYVDYLYTSGITTGYEDGTFRPDQKITRAQFAVMLYRYLKLDEGKYADVTLPFADNDKIGAYAVPAIKALYTEGIINGATGADGRLYFNPNSFLTRAQAATMIGRTQEKGYAAVELGFTDADKIPAYAAFYIQTMAAQGVINGYEDGSFKPQNHITRGQMAKILYNLM